MSSSSGIAPIKNLAAAEIVEFGDFGRRRPSRRSGQGARGSHRSARGPDPRRGGRHGQDAV